MFSEIDMWSEKQDIFQILRHTLDHTAADPASRGLTAKMTKVSFQPNTNPTMKPDKNVQKNWTNTQILSPSPSLMVLMSLFTTEEKGKQKKDTEMKHMAKYIKINLNNKLLILCYYLVCWCAWER